MRGSYPINFETYNAVLKATITYDEIQFDKLVAVIMSSELEQAEDNPRLVKRISFAANHEDESVKKLEEDVSLMAKISTVW